MSQPDKSAFAVPGPEEIFQTGLDEGEFRIQKCGDCDAHIFYPRALCDKCGSPKLETVVAAGGGTVYSTSVVRQRPDDGPDYNIAIVELAEGPRMLTRVEEIDPGEVTIGMDVSAFVGEIDDQKVVLFRPAGGGSN